MNSHIAIEANGKSLVLPEDFSLDIDDQNPLFNDNEMFSYPVAIPLVGNRFLLGNVDDPYNIDRPVALEHTPMRILVDNNPFRSGSLVTSEDEEIEDSLTMNVSASEYSIDDLIGDLSCRDVPLKDRILIGEKIGEVSVSMTYKYRATIKFEGKKGDKVVEPYSTETVTTVFTPQALGFSCPGECYETGSKHVAVADSKSPINYYNGKKRIVPKIKTSYINVSDTYPTAHYCNARISYYHRGLNDDGDESTDKAEYSKSDDSRPEARGPYWVLDADRQQSGICFYVLYFLDCLFANLGVSFDNSELLKVEDMKHLCFFTTHCKYDEEYKYPPSNSSDKKTPDFTSIDDINNWLNSRGTGGHFEIRQGDNLTVNHVDYTADNGTKYEATVGENSVAGITLESTITAKSVSGNIMLMYANSNNFPDESVSTVLDSLYNSFGIKFEYDYEKKHVKAYFLRDVFRSQEKPIDFPGKVISMHKVAEKITGVRMKYSSESTSKEQLANIKNGIKDYDTDYDYVDYPESGTVTNLTYSEICRKPYAGTANNDFTCYIDKTTGNAYRLKVNADAETISDLKPTLFEVGGYKGVELGDCSELNDDFVEEFSSDFQPVIFNDVNYFSELAASSGTLSGGATVTDSDGTTTTASGDVKFNSTNAKQILAAFTDEEMEHEFLEFKISQALSSKAVEYYMDEVLDGLVENYDPSSTDDGNSPLQSIDWGLAIAIMRGGGTNMTYQTYDYNYDGFGNSKWRTVSGEYALTSDSIDNWGNVYDYNGVSEGIGEGERFSLKIRAWKQPDWAEKPLINSDVVDSDGNIETKIKSRGLFDSFMSEYANFILKRRMFRIKMTCSAAQIADVPNHWKRRFRINGMVGYINKLSYSLSAKEGVKDLEVEFYVV